MRRDRMDVTEAVRGKWKGILGTLGVPDSFLTGKHGPCLMCGGKDRWMWDNKDGRGTYICHQCGAGDGWNLLMAFKGWDFSQAAREVRAILGIVEVEPAKPELGEEERRRLCNELWAASRPVQPGDWVDRYLVARGVSEAVYPSSLRTCDRCWFAKGVEHPALIAKVTDAEGRPVTLHRTYLMEGAKLDVPEPRRLMPGKVPPGSAIRLSEPGPVLGIAEGIETALAASQRFEVPVWASLNKTFLAAWEPPPGVEEVLIFADADNKFGGQKAAFSLAHRLAVLKDGPKVEVHLPSTLGTDWADFVERQA